MNYNLIYGSIKTTGCFADQCAVAAFATESHKKKKETRRKKRKATFVHAARRKAQYNHWATGTDTGVPALRSSLRKNAYKGSLHGFTLKNNIEMQKKYKGTNSVGFKRHSDMCRIESAEDKMKEAIFVPVKKETDSDTQLNHQWYQWYEELKHSLLYNYGHGLSEKDIDSLGVREILYLADFLGLDKNIDPHLYMEPKYYCDDFGFIRQEMAPIRVGEVATKLMACAGEDDFAWACEDMDYMFDEE